MPSDEEETDEDDDKKTKKKKREKSREKKPHAVVKKRVETVTVSDDDDETEVTKKVAPRKKHQHARKSVSPGLARPGRGKSAESAAVSEDDEPSSSSVSDSTDSSRKGPHRGAAKKKRGAKKTKKRSESSASEPSESSGSGSSDPESSSDEEDEKLTAEDRHRFKKFTEVSVDVFQTFKLSPPEWAAAETSQHEVAGKAAEWLRSMEYTARIQKIPHAMLMAKVQGTFLKDDARNWFSRLRPEPKSWNEFIKRFRCAYIPDDYVVRCAEDVRNCTSHSNKHDFVNYIEFMQEYKLKLNRLVLADRKQRFISLCDEKRWVELAFREIGPEHTVALERMIKGQTGSPIEKLIRAVRTLFEGSARMARDADPVIREREVRESRNAALRVAAMVTEQKAGPVMPPAMSRDSRRDTNASFAGSQLGAPIEMRRTDIICFRCQGKGHIARDCQSNLASSRARSTGFRPRTRSFDGGRQRAFSSDRDGRRFRGRGRRVHFGTRPREFRSNEFRSRSDSGANQAPQGQQQERKSQPAMDNRSTQWEPRAPGSGSTAMPGAYAMGMNRDGIPRVAGYTNGRSDFNAIRIGKSREDVTDSSESDEEENEEIPTFREALRPLRPQQAITAERAAVAQAYPPEESTIGAGVFQDQLIAAVAVDAPDSPQSEFRKRGEMNLLEEEVLKPEWGGAWMARCSGNAVRARRSIQEEISTRARY